MARLTSRIRSEMRKDPLRKVKQEAVLPEWFNGAGMVAAAVILVAGLIFIGFKVFSGDSTPVIPAANQAESAPQQQVNPYAVSEDEEEGSATTRETGSNAPVPSSSAATPESSSSQDNADYASIETVSIEVETSSLNSRVPEGALNVALAGAEAMATGNWSGIPVDGNPREDRYLGSEIDVESARLTEPVATNADSDTQFTFLFDATDDSGSNIQLSVTTQWGDDAYEVVAF